MTRDAVRFRRHASLVPSSSISSDAEANAAPSKSMADHQLPGMASLPPMYGPSGAVGGSAGSRRPRTAVSSTATRSRRISALVCASPSAEAPAQRATRLVRQR